MSRSPCIPPVLPVESLKWNLIQKPLREALAQISRYDGMLQTLANPHVLLSPITTNEAVLSSKIEGTVATLQEVLQQDAGIKFEENKLSDIMEIRNYREPWHSRSIPCRSGP